ncbi:MAG: hypothetical protein AB7K35_17390, partial [Pseudorhodoplanes sp.]
PAAAPQASPPAAGETAQPASPAVLPAAAPGVPVAPDPRLIRNDPEADEAEEADAGGEAEGEGR